MLSGYEGNAPRADWGEWTLSYAAAIGYTFDPADPQLGKLPQAIAEAAYKLWLAIDGSMDALKGEGAPVESHPLPQRPDAADSTPKASGDSQTSFEAIANTILTSARQGVGVSTKESSASALRFFRELHDTPTPAKITRAMVSQWLDVLARRPAKPTKAQRSIPLSELVELYAAGENMPRLSPKVTGYEIQQRL